MRADDSCPWRRLHLWLGLGVVVVFLASGQVMRLREPPVADLEMELRMLFRSRHIYILMTGLVNVALGLGGALPASLWWRRIAVVGSVLVALAPLLAVAAFLFEAELFAAPGPLAILAVEAVFAGVLLRVLAAVLARRQTDGGEGGDTTRR